MNSRIPPIGWRGLDGPNSPLATRPVGSSHGLMASRTGGVSIVAPNADRAVRSTVTGQSMTGSSQLLMNTHLMRKTRRGFGPENSGI
jgi:hypothetical protein